MKKVLNSIRADLVSQRTRPVFSSSARKSPLHEPMNTRSPTTVGVWASHRRLEVPEWHRWAGDCATPMPPARIIIDTSDADNARMRKVFVLRPT